MIYIARLVLWLIVIGLISWGIHKLINKSIHNERVKPFIGIVVFFIIILAPIAMAKVVQVYYCWKYQPFYEVVKPLEDDFYGYYQESNADSLRTLIQKYPNSINFIDTTEYDRVDKKTKFIRKYIDDNISANCVFPNQDYYNFQKRQLSKGKKVDILDEVFTIGGKCIAKKEIMESEISGYMLGGGIIESKNLIYIPGILQAKYHKGAVFTDRKTKEPYAWGASVGVMWDLYGAFNWWGGGYSFSCSKGFDLKTNMLRKVRNKDGRK
jgi:hypothetical protein